MITHHAVFAFVQRVCLGANGVCVCGCVRALPELGMRNILFALCVTRIFNLMMTYSK